MTALLSLLAALALALHAALMLAAAPLLAGWVRWVEARLVGRAGPPLLQPWRDMLRLAAKQRVVAESAGWATRLAPAAVFAATLAAAALVPSFTLGMTDAPLADLIVLAGVLASARFVMVLAAMDAGTPFGGIGAARATAFAAFAEPALLLVVFTLALVTGTTNLDAIAGQVREGVIGLHVSMAMALLALLAVALAETGRMPVDNAATHLELTMVDEAMLLEFSGPDLALLHWAGSLRLLLWCSLVVAVFAPFGIAAAGASPLDWIAGALAWAAKMSAVGVVLALMEVGTAKMRVLRVPEFLGVAVLLGLLAVILLFVSQGFA